MESSPPPRLSLDLGYSKVSLKGTRQGVSLKGIPISAENKDVRMSISMMFRYRFHLDRSLEENKGNTL